MNAHGGAEKGEMVIHEGKSGGSVTVSDNWLVGKRQKKIRLKGGGKKRRLRRKRRGKRGRHLENSSQRELDDKMNGRGPDL